MQNRTPVRTVETLAAGRQSSQEVGYLRTSDVVEELTDWLGSLISGGSG